MRTRPLDWTALTLCIIGAINWGLVGFFQFDLIAALFGGADVWISRVIYAVIGLAGLYCLTLYSRIGDNDRSHVISDSDNRFGGMTNR